MVDTAYVTLALVPGIGRARLDQLLHAFGTARAALSASLEELRVLPGMNRAAASAVRAAGNSGEEVCRRVEELGAAILTPADASFPEMMREIPDAPPLLFVLGRLDLLNTDCVAIVGSRNHTRYGAEVCRHLAGGMARRGVTVVSGMARGLDAIAHTAALDVGGPTIGVLGNGLGIVYPAAHEALYDRVAASGCLLTECPPGERPHAGSFPRRNRLISGLARATVIVEARNGSGALITADCALSQGREVMAVPGPITSPVSNGTNRLLQLGAKPVLGLRDVLEEYGVGNETPRVSIASGLSEAERSVLDVLDREEGHVDLLAARLGWSAAEVLAALTSLEIRGLVMQMPGKLFRRALDVAEQNFPPPSTGGMERSPNL